MHRNQDFRHLGFRRVIHACIRSGESHRPTKRIAQSAKALFARCGFFNQELYDLRVSAVRPTDTFVASYPKSGNTWLRFIIANLMTEDVEVTFRNIDRFVPEPDFATYSLDDVRGSRIIKSHWPYFPVFPRFIYVVRDPRDVVVSHYHFSVKHAWFRGPIEEFVGSRQRFGDWGTHVRGALNELLHRPSDVLMLRYEDMLDDPHRAVEKVASFLHLQPSPETVERVVGLTTFKTLKKNERLHGGMFSAADGGFFRSGRTGQWQTEVPDSVVRALEEKYGELMKRCGYPVGCAKCEARVPEAVRLPADVQ